MDNAVKKNILDTMKNEEKKKVRERNIILNIQYGRIEQK